MRFPLRYLALAAVSSLGCTAAAERTGNQPVVDGKAAGTVVADSAQAAPTAVRALYVNRWVSQSRKRMAKLIAIADSTEINGLVIDMKDEFGLNYATKNPEFAKNAGTASKISNVTALLDTVGRVRDTLNPTLALEGLLLTMFDSRNSLARQVQDEVRTHFGDQVFRAVIPRNVRVSESPSHGMPVLVYDPTSRGAVAYRALAREIAAPQRAEPAEHPAPGS